MDIRTIIEKALYEARGMTVYPGKMKLLAETTAEQVLEALQEKCPNYNSCTEYIMESLEPYEYP